MIGLIKYLSPFFTFFGFSCSASNINGIDGPYISASNIPTFEPRDLSARAIFVAKVDLPTPPFALDIAIVCGVRPGRDGH